MPLRLTRRFAFGQDIDLLRPIEPTEGRAVGIATNEHGERSVEYIGVSVLMARSYMRKRKEATVYILTAVGWRMIEGTEGIESEENA